jgi:hypothetical protein
MTAHSTVGNYIKEKQMKKILSINLLLNSMFLAHATVGAAQMAPVAVDGTVHEFQEYLADAQFQNSDSTWSYSTSGQFRWGNGINASFRSVNADRASLTEHLIADAYYNSSTGWSTGNLTREFPFQIAGRDPSRSYFISAFQTITIKNGDNRPGVGPDAGTYHTLYLTCAADGSQVPGGRAITRTNEYHGQWFENQNLGFQVTISPGICPSNQFKVNLGSFGAQDLVLKPLRLSILNIQ